MKFNVFSLKQNSPMIPLNLIIYTIFFQLSLKNYNKKKKVKFISLNRHSSIEMEKTNKIQKNPNKNKFNYFGHNQNSTPGNFYIR